MLLLMFVSIFCISLWGAMTQCVERGGSVVVSMPCIRRVAGSTLTLATAYKLWPSFSLVVAYKTTNICPVYLISN